MTAPMHAWRVGCGAGTAAYTSGGAGYCRTLDNKTPPYVTAMDVTPDGRKFSDVAAGVCEVVCT